MTLSKTMEDPNSSTTHSNISIQDLAQQLRLYRSPSQKDSINTHHLAHQFCEQEHKPNSRAAVLICLFKDEEQADLKVILTKRSSNLSKHSGEVALPGGKTDDGDADDIHTALREAHDEIGLDPSLVDVVAVLDPLVTKNGMTVVPVIGMLYDKKKFSPVANAAEVEAIFYAPLEMFLKDENRSEVQREWMGEKYLLHFFDFEADNTKYVIWALTAGILIRAASVVYQRQPAFEVLSPKFWGGNHQCKY